MTSDCSEVKAAKLPQEQFQSALRHLIEEPEQSPQRASLGASLEQPKPAAHQSAL